MSVGRGAAGRPESPSAAKPPPFPRYSAPPDRAWPQGAEWGAGQISVGLIPASTTFSSTMSMRSAGRFFASASLRIDLSAIRRALALVVIRSFAKGLELDRAAVDAGLTLPYHNGRSEGVNTRTKRIMRDMHGRAGFATARPPLINTRCLGPHYRRLRDGVARFDRPATEMGAVACRLKGLTPN